ncbi:MAG: hypothetical protein HYT98_02795 [Candidatus Sungbacteria bacterium]|nr:hypothetical protein [Candidatus Sungbacteria bacterium]
MNYNYFMTTQTLEKLIKIEKELLKVKKEGSFLSFKAPISLRGMFKGVKIAGKDIKAAKKSLFKIVP